MPNILDANGLQTQTYTELVAYFTDNYQLIYGADITLDPDTPDGQWMNIQIQAILDLLDVLTQVYNTMDPDNAVGVVLDQRAAINGIQHQAGTYTITAVVITTNVSVNLYGVDQSTLPNAQPVYTVADNAGNQWQLQTTVTGLAVGANTLDFQAANAGADGRRDLAEDRDHSRRGCRQIGDGVEGERL